MVSGSAYTTITKITPSPMSMGSDVTITGQNFGATQGNSKLYLNDVDISAIKSWNDTKIVFTMPSTGVGPGPIKIVTPAGEISSQNNGISRSLNINEWSKWNSTGMQLKQNQNFTVTATGVCVANILGTLVNVTPDGVSNSGSSASPFPFQPIGALYARIGTVTFAAGSSYAGKAASDNVMELLVNGGSVAGTYYVYTSGSYDITITAE